MGSTADVKLPHIFTSMTPVLTYTSKCYPSSHLLMYNIPPPICPHRLNLLTYIHTRWISSHLLSHADFPNIFSLLLEHVNSLCIYSCLLTLLTSEAPHIYPYMLTQLTFFTSTHTSHHINWHMPTSFISGEVRSAPKGAGGMDQGQTASCSCILPQVNPSPHSSSPTPPSPSPSPSSSPSPSI